MSNPEPLRVALFTLDSALSAAALRDLAVAEAGRLVLIGRSNPMRASAGGSFGQLAAHWRRSGPRLLPFLLAGYVLPQWLGTLRQATGGGALTRLARDHGIPLHAVEDVNGPATAAALRAARPDVILSFNFDQIFTAATLALAPQGGLNLHPSLLPLHRGPLPAFWALREQPARTGVTLHRLAPRIDAGAVLAQRAVELPPGTTVAAATRRLHAEGVSLCRQVLAVLAEAERQGTPPPEPPPPAPLPYCPFPPADLLRRGPRLVDAADLLAALRAPTG